MLENLLEYTDILDNLRMLQGQSYGKHIVIFNLKSVEVTY